MKKHNKAAVAQEIVKPIAKKKVNAGFLSFLFKDARQRNLILFTLVLNALMLTGYKHFYPMPDFFSDSYGYVLSAAKDLEIFYRPLGYAHFLSLLHGLSETSTFVVAVQYFMLSLAGLFCFFSVDYLFGYHHRGIRMTVWALITINPLFLVLSNQIASDSLFTTLTITWFTLLVWVLNQGNWISLILQLIILMLAFEVRYNALYYPAVACVVFLLTKNKEWVYKIIGIAVTVIGIAFSYNRIKDTTERLTNAPVFAGFSGWQLANNALYVYPFANVKPEEFEEPELKTLNEFVNVYLDSLNANEQQELKTGNIEGALFIWSKNSPLKKYVQYYCNQNRIQYMAGWYQVSETYNAFGQHIIKNHTADFIRHYLLINSGYFFFPSREKMLTYNADNTKVADDTKAWFHFNSIELTPNGNTMLQKKIVLIYPSIHALLVMLSLLLPLLCFLKLRSRKLFLTEERNLMIYWYVFFLMNAAFSIFASIIALRYEAAWFVLSICLPLLFLDRMINIQRIESVETNSITTV